MWRGAIPGDPEAQTVLGVGVPVPGWADADAGDRRLFGGGGGTFILQGIMEQEVFEVNGCLFDRTGATRPSCPPALGCGV